MRTSGTLILATLLTGCTQWLPTREPYRPPNGAPRGVHLQQGAPDLAQEFQYSAPPGKQPNAFDPFSE